MESFKFDKEEQLRECGEGPWLKEDDKVTWVDQDTGLDCMVKRNRMGAWCGYVGVPPGHPMHGKNYSDVEHALPDLHVHGGLTYSDECQHAEGADPAHLICHKAEPGRPDPVWWLGFDCSHYMDLTPSLKRREMTFGDEVYRDQTYVTLEVVKLAKQLKEAEHAAE